MASIPQAILIGALLATATLTGLAATASAHGPSLQEVFVLGGAHASAEVPSDPGTVVDEEPAAGAATCQPERVLPGPAPDGGVEPVISPSLGGACFSTSIFDDRAALTVDVDRFYVTVPEHPGVGFAAGYDLDADGCVGCTPVDALWTGTNSVTVPVLEGTPTLAVFVYALETTTDPIAPYQVSNGEAGVITVSPAEEAPDCFEDPSIPERECGSLPLDERRPHLCVPACELVTTQAD